MITNRAEFDRIYVYDSFGKEVLEIMIIETKKNIVRLGLKAKPEVKFLIRRDNVHET